MLDLLYLLVRRKLYPWLFYGLLLVDNVGSRDGLYGLVLAPNIID